MDRFPLITSAIINVDQDVDELWPLEVYDRNGVALNVSMQPGDVVSEHQASFARNIPGMVVANDYLHLLSTFFSYCMKVILLFMGDLFQ